MMMIIIWYIFLFIYFQLTLILICPDPNKDLETKVIENQPREKL